MIRGLGFFNFYYGVFIYFHSHYSKKIFSSSVFLPCFFQFAATKMFLTVMHKKTNKAPKWGCVQPWMMKYERARV